MVKYASCSLLGDPALSSPLLICFHGSGDSCRSWKPLAERLSSSNRTLLWDRQILDAKPDESVGEMFEYLDQYRLEGPYILIAHSYGGMFARFFLQKRPSDVVGMVLVETGQETELPNGLGKWQYRTRILKNNPLVVIRANTLMKKWEEYHSQLASRQESGLPAGPDLEIQKRMLLEIDKEDERLKRAQLALSSKSKYMQLPDCGHMVITQRPEAVEEAVTWILNNLAGTKQDRSKIRTLMNLFNGLKQWP